MSDQVELGKVNNKSKDDITLTELFHRISDLFSFILTQWKKIIIGSFLGGVLGFVIAWFQPIEYEAAITFVVEEAKSPSNGLAGLASLAGQFGVDVGGGGGGGLFAGDNTLIYIKSPSLSREVLLSAFDKGSTKSVADVYSETYKLKNAWLKNSKIGEVNFQINKPGVKYTRLEDSLLQLLTERINKSELSVTRTDKKAAFIEVNATMQNEALAKIYCERLVKAAVDRYVQMKTARQQNTVDKLQKRLDSVAYILNAKTISGAQLQTNSSTMDINPLYKAGTMVTTETTLRDKTMLATIFASVTQNLEMAKFTLSQETPVIQIVDAPILPLKQEKVSKLKTAIILAFVTGFIISIILITKRKMNKLLNK